METGLAPRCRLLERNLKPQYGSGCIIGNPEVTPKMEFCLDRRQFRRNSIPGPWSGFRSPFLGCDSDGGPATPNERFGLFAAVGPLAHFPVKPKSIYSHSHSSGKEMEEI
jgi:hypothetical protein